MRVSKNLPLVQQLIDSFEECGGEVHLNHIRLGDPIEIVNVRNPVQAFTKVSLVTKDKSYEGWALCVKGDSFCKAVGTEIAFTRAMHALFHDLNGNV